MVSVLDTLSEIFEQAFSRVLSSDYNSDAQLGQVRFSDRPDLAQFQCNGAMVATRLAKRSPRDIAADVIKALESHPFFAQLFVAGPGFINISLTDDVLVKFLIDQQEGVQPTGQSRNKPGTEDNTSQKLVMMDYGGPNIAKPLHIGHLRAAIIGEALKNLYRFCGDRVISDIHLGDWGLPMGMLIDALRRNHPDWPYFDRERQGDYPHQAPVSLQDLQDLYPQAAAACKNSPERLEAARRATLALQEGHPGYRALWQHFVDISLEDAKKNFARLGVAFELWEGEASVHPLIPQMIAELVAQGTAIEDQAALIIPVTQIDDSPELPPFILAKSDGAALYSTTDLATIKNRRELYQPDRILYITDGRQSLHFEQVFRAARKAGYAANINLVHIGFGTMNGPDGKPFKTRAGGVMPLADLLDEVEKTAQKRVKEMYFPEMIEGDQAGEDDRGSLGHDQGAIKTISRQIALAAIKFADLGNQLRANYIFDLERMTKFEGKTGPYLQYTMVRIKNLLDKAKIQGIENAPQPEAGHPQSRELILRLLQFPGVVRGCYEKNSLHELCTHGFELAQKFSQFYQQHHILSAQDKKLQAQWLCLITLVQRQLQDILTILGIPVPERM